MEKEKCICETGKEVDDGMTYRIKDKVLEIEYEAYSCDSSFGFDDSGINIKFCPFCGRKL